jgi:hypothetical protein
MLVAMQTDRFLSRTRFVCSTRARTCPRSSRIMSGGTTWGRNRVFSTTEFKCSTAVFFFQIHIARRNYSWIPFNFIFSDFSTPDIRASVALMIMSANVRCALFRFSYDCRLSRARAGAQKRVLCPREKHRWRFADRRRPGSVVIILLRGKTSRARRWFVIARAAVRCIK